MVQERIESFKAGACAAIALSLGFVLISGLHALVMQMVVAEGLAISAGSSLNRVLLGLRDDNGSALLQPVDLLNLMWWLRCAIAGISGFLFGVTYRYVVRTDQNSNLKMGAVGAFGLVRGLAQIDTGVVLKGNGWLLLILLGESVVLFAIAQLVLEIGFKIGGFKPLDLSISKPHESQELSTDRPISAESPD